MNTGLLVRRTVLALTLVSQLLGAVGLPVPAPPSKPTDGTPYPCQSRPCGCVTSELCWAGDCCCFTLEEKLAWADANGVEPPAHVRPAVDARRHTAPAKKKACCREADELTCRDEPTAACDVPPPPAVRWVLGVSAKRCHGLGPDGLFALDPVVFPAPVIAPRPSEPTAFDRPASERFTSTTFPPPVPPPNG